MTVGIVAVSHSLGLAEAARDLALQMVPSGPPPLALAAGTSDGGFGTDATAVAAAIEQVSSADGVLVLMDLGSAVLSAEMALEFLTAQVEVRLSDAPFVEGLLAATVRAASGASLADVDREARAALAPKQSQLGTPETSASGTAPEAAGPDAAPQTPDPRPPEASTGVTARELIVTNAVGIHARPAALIAQAAAGFESAVSIADLSRGTGPIQADSSILLMALGARTGDTVRIQADGPDSVAAVAAIAALFEDDFGE